MSLPETIWCCQTHPHNGHECKGRCLSRRKKCPCELRVAGPDDLLIRREDIAQVVALVEEQAEDEGLWFIARTAPEAYLQQELRRLHAVIESALAATEGEDE